MGSGIVSVNFAPKSGLFSARNCPSCASIIERETAKPIPMPFSLVVTKASKIFSGSPMPRAVVDHLNGNLLSVHRSPDRYLGLARVILHRLDRVDDQINEHFLNLYRINADPWKIILENALDGNSSLVLILLDEANGFADHLRYAGFLPVERFSPEQRPYILHRL